MGFFNTIIQPKEGKIEDVHAPKIQSGASCDECIRSVLSILEAHHIVSLNMQTAEEYSELYLSRFK